MPSITISTCTDPESYAEIKKNHWKVPELIRLGIWSKKNNPQLISRLKEVERMNGELAVKVQRYAKKIYDIEQKEAAKVQP